MRKQHFLQVLFSLLLTTFAVVATTSCGGDDNNGPKTPATLEVNPNSLVLDADAGASETFAVTTSATWTATVSGQGFTLDKTSGTGDAVITVTAAAANNEDKQKMLGSVTIAARGVEGTKEVTVSQLGAPLPDPTPADVTIVVDFAEGPNIATPELPPYSKTDFTTGRHEYTIKGYKFAVYADEAEGGKFYWLDNTQFGGTIPEPNKCLFFSKLGAYVEFPAIAGKTLSMVRYLPSTQQNNVELDLMGADGSEAEYSLDFDDDGTYVYELINAKADMGYRIEIINTKNAQLAKLRLDYTSPQ